MLWLLWRGGLPSRWVGLIAIAALLAVAPYLALFAQYGSPTPRTPGTLTMFFRRTKASKRRFPRPPLLCRNRRQLEHSTVFGCLGNIATAQSQPHSLKLVGIAGRQVRRPGGIVFDQIDGDLGGVLAFMNELF